MVEDFRDDKTLLHRLLHRLGHGLLHRLLHRLGHRLLHRLRRRLGHRLLHRLGHGLLYECLTGILRLPPQLHGRGDFPPVRTCRTHARIQTVETVAPGGSVIRGMVKLRVTVGRIIAFLVQSRHSMGPLPAVHTALEHGHGGIPVGLLPLAGEEHLTAAAHYGFGLRHWCGRCEPHAVGEQRIAGQYRRLRRLRDVLRNSRLELGLELDDGIGMFLRHRSQHDFYELVRLPYPAGLPHHGHSVASTLMYGSWETQHTSRVFGASRVCPEVESGTFLFQHESNTAPPGDRHRLGQGPIDVQALTGMDNPRRIETRLAHETVQAKSCKLDGRVGDALLADIEVNPEGFEGTSIHLPAPCCTISKRSEGEVGVVALCRQRKSFGDYVVDARTRALPTGTVFDTQRKIGGETERVFARGKRGEQTGKKTSCLLKHTLCPMKRRFSGRGESQ